MKTLHFAPDEKFIPLQQRLYDEAFPGKGTWRIESSDGLLRHCRPDGSLKAVLPSYYSSDEAIEDARSCDLLVVHSMNVNHAVGILTCAPVIPVFWRGWGADYSHLMAAAGQPLLLPATARLQRNIELSEMLLRLLRPGSLLKGAYNRLRRRLSWPSASLEGVAPLLDLFRVQENDVDLVKGGLPGLTARYMDGPHYYTTEDVLEKGGAEMSGHSILLGNSASATNNHIEAIDILRRVLPKGDDAVRVVVPLSYGNPRYADAIVGYGTKSLGSAFRPLREWMSLESYQRQLQDCGTVVMNHCRQQAYGNVAAALYKGARVFMRPENSTYQRFREMGLELFPVEALEDSKSAFLPLDVEVARRNKTIIGEYLAREKSITSIRSVAMLLPELTRSA